MVAVRKERRDAAHGSSEPSMHRGCGATNGEAWMAAPPTRRFAFPFFPWVSPGFTHGYLSAGATRHMAA